MFTSMLKAVANSLSPSEHALVHGVLVEDEIGILEPTDQLTNGYQGEH